jgi:hypothetical protein
MMPSSRFDAWTRRRFGTASVGALAGLLGVSGQKAMLARKKKKRGKQRKRPCEKLGTRCNPNNDKQLCCGALYCQNVPDLGGNRCCKSLHLSCLRDADCCGNLICVGNDGARSCRTGP